MVGRSAAQSGKRSKSMIVKELICGAVLPPSFKNKIKLKFNFLFHSGINGGIKKYYNSTVIRAGK